MKDPIEFPKPAKPPKPTTYLTLGRFTRTQLKVEHAIGFWKGFFVGMFWTLVMVWLVLFINHLP